MKILMYGVNQDTVSVEDIDKYTLDETTKVRQLHDIKEFTGVEEICIMSSGFRTEYYLNVDETVFKHGDLLRYLSTFTGKPLKEIILETYSKFNKDVVHHLFTVVSGLESRPKGSYTTLKYAENALSMSVKETTVGETLSELFENAIKFSRKMRLSETMRPLYKAQPSHAMDTMIQSIGELRDKKYVLFGSGYDIIHLSKLFLSLNIQSLTIANEDRYISEKMIGSLNDWSSEALKSDFQTRLHAADLISVGYRFSNADGIIISPSFDCDSLSHELLESVDTIRQTLKKQIIVDFNNSNKHLFDHLGETVTYTSIKDQHIKEFTEDELTQADIYFDENLTQVTEKFMEKYHFLTDKMAQESIKRITIMNQAVSLEPTHD